MRSLRSRLVAAFLVATLLPLGATIWITTSLLERSLGYATTEELDLLSQTLERTMRQFYERERRSLKADAAGGRAAATPYAAPDASAWPEPVRSFWESGEPERFALSGSSGDRLDYMTRVAERVNVYSRELGGIQMQALAAQLRDARELVGSMEGRDLRRGFTLTLLLLVALVWLVSLAPLFFIAHRISRPIQELTAGLTRFAAGDWDQRLAPARDDEVGQAVAAFNHMAEQLRRSRERLVYLTQISSWESLARKTAHELKNSLTPIRLTVEEMVARQPHSDRAFMQEAAQIVISEIETLERRVRAFSEFASEPAVNPEVLDVNAIVGERVALLTPAHPTTIYRCRLDPLAPHAWAGTDLVDRSSYPTRLTPANRLRPPSAQHYLGTDEFGRDVYSLVLHGSRVSLLVGLTTMLLTSAGGIVIGLAAGYSRRLDVPVMRCMDGLMAFPAILLAIALMAARGPGVWNVILALSVVYMPRTAMIIRSTVLSLRELDYIQAARALGRRDSAIALRHILPNCVGPLLVQGSFVFAYAILAEAILGFLGVGVPPYVPSWGNVIASGKNVIREAFWVSLFPGLALTVAGLSLNLLGDGLRDVLDPRLRVR